MLRLLLILGLLFMIPSFANARKATIADVERIYGIEFENTPPILRLKFENDTQKSWRSASYDEKEAFLLEWQTQKLINEKEEQTKAKEELTRQKKETAAKKEFLRKKEIQKRKEADAQREKKRAEAQEKKRRQELLRK